MRTTFKWFFCTVLIRSFHTISQSSESLLKEKGSKFYGYAFPCKNELEAKNFIQDLKKVHHTARHFCYAYRFGHDLLDYRANDDGEPNNSAGMPILGQIQSFGVTNVLVVVVRYFGGVKLGVGGLVSAYKETAKMAMENSIIIEKKVTKKIEIHFEYEFMPKVMNVMKQFNMEILSQDFNLSCILIFRCPVELEVQVLDEISPLIPIINEIYL